MAYLLIPAGESAGRMAAIPIPPGLVAFREAVPRPDGGRGLRQRQLRRPKWLCSPAAARCKPGERGGPDCVSCSLMEVLSAKLTGLFVFPVSFWACL